MLASGPSALAAAGSLGAFWRDAKLEASPTTTSQGLWASWLCWAILLALCRVRTWLGKASVNRQEHEVYLHGRVWPTRLRLLALSIAIVTSQAVKVLGVSQSILPFPTLAVCAAQWIKAGRGLQAPTAEELEELNEPRALKRDLSHETPPWTRVVLFVVAGVGASALLTIPLTQSHLATTILFSVSFFLSRTASFILLTQSHQTSDQEMELREVVISWGLLEQMSFRCFWLFTLLIALIVPRAFTPSLTILVSAMVEASWWGVVTVLCAWKMPIVPTTFDTIAASFQQSLSRPSYPQATLVAIPAMTAIWQAVTSIPSSYRHRHLLYVLILIPIVGRISYSEYRHFGKSGYTQTDSGLHAVEEIVAGARARFSSMLDRQSTSVDQAVTEYQKRYGREPPPQFDVWFNLAKHHSFALVDEFDVLMQSLEPFWGLAPAALHTLCDSAIEQLHDKILKYEIRDHQVSASQGDRSPWFASAFAGWLPEEWLRILPDMRLAINVYDEPSVCIPRDVLDALMHSAHRISKRGLERAPRFVSLGRQDAWESTTISCPVQSPARNIDCKPPPTHDLLPFINNLTRSKDACEHCELQFLEGIMFAPETLDLTHSPVPIWSQGKPSTFNDILFPSPYYDLRRQDYVESEDLDWELKENNVYWVGAATGGYATQQNWKDMQRQRLTLMTQPDSEAPIRLLAEESPGTWRSYATNISEVSSLFQTRIMGVTPQCEAAACEAQRAAFGIGDAEIKDPLGASYAHRFLLDLDGNSFSGRFYRLLQSRSVVLKQSIFQEWHDDRLVPWVHYVPVGTGFDELPELVRFLATTESGQGIASRMASESREWAAKTLRTVDFQLVWLRLLMEYGRMVDPDRQL